MPQLDKAIVKERAARLRAQGEAALAARFAALAGTTQTLLVEKNGIGRTECFAAARIDAAPGTFVTARITGASNGQLLAAA
jgi:threonylcarbamoyladenosine tRNA methylthiotransferase MtaB